MSEPNRNRINSMTTQPVDKESRKAYFKGKLNQIKKGEHVSREKFNSTSTTFVDSTIQNPDKMTLMRCMAQKVQEMIKPQNKTDPEMRKQIKEFDEVLRPLMNGTCSQAIPPVSEVQDFIEKIYKIGDMHPASIVMATFYLNRVLNETKVDLFPWSWRRVLLSCLILASKVWEDESVWNVDFLDLFPSSSLKDLSDCESIVLDFLKFDVEITASNYTKTYFELRTKSALKNDEYFDELKPLSEQQMEKLTNQSKDIMKKKKEK